MIYGCGIDIVSIKRIEDIYEKHGERFLRRVLTDLEMDYCMAQKAFPLNLAGRFAVKEAVIKAFKTGLSGGVTWHDMEVVSSGPPHVALSGRLQEISAGIGMKAISISIAHEKEHAVGLCIIEV